MMKDFQKAYKLFLEIMISITREKELKRQYVQIESGTNQKWYKNK